MNEIFGHLLSLFIYFVPNRGEITPRIPNSRFLSSYLNSELPEMNLISTGRYYSVFRLAFGQKY
jgi:hypothetical protein